MKGHSLRKSINAKCADCIYDKANGGTRAQQISLCTCFDCPLWLVRPLSGLHTPQEWADKAALTVGLTAPELN